MNKVRYYYTTPFKSKQERYSEYFLSKKEALEWGINYGKKLEEMFNRELTLKKK